MNGKKILLVDDDPSVLRCYERLMQRSGYVPVTVSDGRHLLDRIHAHDDAVLLIIDYQMPKMNGLLLLDRLRERGFLGPVLLISALMSEEARELARRLGVVRILEKPVETQDLLACIRGIVGPGLPARGGANRHSSATG
jgi:DNA-binding response OmpR family regulator